MMFWRRWLGLLVLLLTGAAPVAKAVNGSGAAALFYSEYGAAVKLSWLMDASSLRYSRNAAGLAGARVVTEISIYQDTTVYREQNFVVETTPVPVEELSLQHLLLQRRLALRPGLNRIRLRLYQEEAPEEAWVYEKTLQVLKVLPEGPVFSTLQLLDTFFASSEHSTFSHKGFIQYPKPFAFYGEGERRLGFYLELYGADKIDTALFPLSCRIGLVKKGGIQLLPAALFYDTIRRAARQSVHSFRSHIDLSTVASGNYNLTAQLLDRNGREMVRQTEAFQLVNRQPDPVVVAVDSSKPTAASAADTGASSTSYLNLAETFVGKYKNEEVNAILRMLLPVASELQKFTINGFLERPDPLLARYFIYNYFEAQNPKHPEVAWKQYADKIREVNALFAGRGGTAYSTDRGRIYLRYGKPTERIRVVSENGALPYEIWTYRQIVTNGSPGKFLFYQPNRMGSDFRLLHSTVLDEPYDTHWRDKLYPDGGSGNVDNSRAEQEFGN